MMSLQWGVIAAVLYAEIGFMMLLMLPWIRPSFWQSIFNSRIVRSIDAFSHVFVYGFTAILFLLFADAIREVRKYADAEVAEEADHMRSAAGADILLHMRLFRAQRNLYISGFALFLAMVIKRTIRLKVYEAKLEACAEAAMKQALSRTNNKKETKSDEEEDSHDSANDKDETIVQLRKELEVAHLDRDTMKKQSESLKREYDRLLAAFSEKEASKGNKKDQ